VLHAPYCHPLPSSPQWYSAFTPPYKLGGHALTPPPQIMFPRVQMLPVDRDDLKDNPIHSTVTSLLSDKRINFLSIYSTPLWRSAQYTSFASRGEKAPLPQGFSTAISAPSEHSPRPPPRHSSPSDLMSSSPFYGEESGTGSPPLDYRGTLLTSKGSGVPFFHTTEHSSF